MSGSLPLSQPAGVMASLRRHLQLVLVGLFFLGFILFSMLLGTPQPPRPYDLNSARSDGLLALRLWLQEMSYRVESGRPDARTLWDGEQLRTHMLLVYPNVQPLDADEAKEIRDWVEAGGTLVLIGTEATEVELVDVFGVYTVARLSAIAEEAQSQPLLPDAPASARRLGLTDVLDLRDAPRAVPVLTLGGAAEGEEPVANGDTSEPDADDSDGDSADESAGSEPNATAAVQPVGAGWVWHLTLRYDLANAALRDEEVARLLPALLRTVPERGVILVDAYHLYGEGMRVAGEITSIWAWLQRTALGRAISFAGLLTFLFLLVQGRRLGPPLPSVNARQPREAAEYVIAMAGLQRRSHQRRAIAQHHSQRLKSALARTTHIPPDLDDAQFLARLREQSPPLPQADQRTVARLLQTLQRDLSESALVQTVADMDAFLQTSPRRRASDH